MESVISILFFSHFVCEQKRRDVWDKNVKKQCDHEIYLKLKQMEENKVLMKLHLHSKGLRTKITQIEKLENFLNLRSSSSWV